MEITKLLDDCKQKLSVDTDYKLSKLTGISEARLSDYRHAKRVPDPYACFKIAEILELDEKALIAHFEAISAKNEKMREFWKKKLAELGGVAAGIFLTVNLMMTPHPAEAAPTLKSDMTMLYIM